MQYTQNQKIQQLSGTTLIVGVDIGSETHWARFFDYRGIELTKKPLSFSNSRHGFNVLLEYINAIKIKAQKTSVVVGLEPTGHYWFCLWQFLLEQQIKVVIVNPFAVKRSKELDDNNPSKTDKKDPKVIAMLVKDGRYCEPYMPQEIFAEIRELALLRRQYVKQLVGIKNRLYRWIKIYFPEFNEVFRGITGKAAMLTLKNFPLPKQISELGSNKIAEMWKSIIKRGVGLKRAQMLVEKARESIGLRTGDSEIISIQLIILQHEQTKTNIDYITGELLSKSSKIPNVDKLLAIKGLGAITIAGIIAEIGDIKRFCNPKQIQSLAGLNLRENSSGKHKGNTRISKRGRQTLRHVLFQAAIPLIAFNKTFKALHQHYTQRANNPLKKVQSVVAIANKLIRVMYKILTTGIEYNDQKLITDIKYNIPELPLVA